MNSELSELLTDLRKKSKIDILHVSDLKFLEEDILYKTNSKISFNTLRRLYGFLPKTKTSKKTLDILSKYLGFQSFSAYLNNKNLYDDWYFKMKILRIQEKRNTPTDKEVTLLQTALENNINIIMVSDFVGNLIENKKKETLILFFKNLKYQSILDSNKIKLAIIATYSFYKLSNNNRIELYKQLIHIDAFKYCIPFGFIDYSYLNGYYFKVLQAIKKLNKNESDILFVDLMLNLKEYFSNKINKTIQIKEPINKADIHPVLLGRYFGWLILANQKLKPKLKEEINSYLKKGDPKLLLIEIVPALILTEEFNYLGVIIDLYYEEIFVRDRWTAEGQGFNFLIGLANVNIFNNNLKGAKINLKFINTEKIESSYTDYLTLFLNLSWLKIAALENDAKNIDFYYNSISSLANKNGFFKFIEIANQYKIN